MTVLEVLNLATGCLKDHRISNPRLNAELLLAHSLSLSREGLYIHLHDPIGEQEREASEALIKRRLSGEPLQYILGRQEFWSIDVKVDSRVLIPRADTELLVEQTLSILSKNFFEKPPSILEIGTGSGAIAIALAREVKQIFLVATDISREALVLAKQNALEAGVLERVAFVHGDLFSPFHLHEGKEPFDMILSNPPYIVRSEIEQLAKEVKDYEPSVALDGGEDGLDFYRKLISQGPPYLRKEGWLLLEIGQGQGERISEWIEKGGDFSAPQRIKDLSGIERVVKAKKMESRK